MNKLRILAASDIEGDRRAVKQLAEKADKDNVDVVLLCGDITDFDMDVDGLIGPFLEKKKHVLFVTGNHDMPAAADFISRKYNIKNLQQYAAQLGDVGFFGCGAANIGPNFMDEDDMFYYLKHGFERVKGCKKRIMVTHVHPAGSKADREFFIPGTGSHAVSRAIAEFKPDIHVCGHMHEFEGLEDYTGKTRMLSVGKHGTVFDI
jgi:Icc-related predicted phosphoesterase